MRKKRNVYVSFFVHTFIHTLLIFSSLYFFTHMSNKTHKDDEREADSASETKQEESLTFDKEKWIQAIIPSCEYVYIGGVKGKKLTFTQV